MVLKVDKDEAAKTLDNRDEMHITVPVKKKKSSILLFEKNVNRYSNL